MRDVHLVDDVNGDLIGSRASAGGSTAGNSG
jgi:hypothetical protein